MAGNFKPPTEFEEFSRPAESWMDWRQRYNIYARATGLEKKEDSIQVAILLHLIGPVGLKHYNNFSLPSTAKVEEILTAFDEYYRPYRNITHLSYVFFTTKQGPDQSADHFIADLRTQARDCDFGSLTDRLVRDIIICGVRDNELRAKLLSLRDPSLTEVITMCRASEQAKSQTATMTSFVSAKEQPPLLPNKLRDDTVYSIKTQGANKVNLTFGNNRKQNNFHKPSNCTRCGRKHEPRSCPAFGKVCNKCKKKNHFASECKLRGIYMLSDPQEEPTDEEEEQENYLVSSVECSNSFCWYKELFLNNNQVKFKLDTGSEINLVSLELINSWKERPKLFTHVAKAVGISGHTISIIGKIKGSLSSNKNKLVTDIYVTNSNVPPILNGLTCMKLNLIKRLYSLVLDNPPTITPESLIKKYPDVFAPSLGKFKQPYKITIDKEAVPVVAPARKIPQALQKIVKKELDRMEKDKVIERVHHPTDWVNALLTVQKNGKTRIVLDPRPLNKVIKRQYHPIPQLDTIIDKLGGCKLFTVLDGRDAFWQMCLDETSSKLCTFSSPFGRYKFLRVPYGISAAPEYQQKTMDELCEGLEATVPFIDDIIIGGRDLKEHNKRLEAFLSKARSAGLHLKAEKTQLAQTSVTFMGHILSADGLKPVYDKVKTINAITSPNNKEELQRFLGLVNYLSKFLPNLSSNTVNMRRLLRNDTKWLWDETTQKEFTQVKSLVNSAPVLANFDPKLPLVLSVDASKHGIGAVLLQNGRPIQYASVSLTSAQQNYAQIEKEMLAIVFGTYRFDYYTFGRKITIETDHKPLLSIINKPLEKISPRLQRMVLRLQRYSFVLKYVPGRYLYIADTLSRSPTEDIVPPDIDDDQMVIHSIVTIGDTSSQMHQDFRTEIEKDPEYSTLVETIMNGWPSNIAKLPTVLHMYWKYRDELYYFKGLVYKSKQLLVPFRFRKEILGRIHETHQGIVASKARARENVFWPGMNSEIENLIRSCHACQVHATTNIKEPLKPHPIPSGAWERIAADLFTFKEAVYLLVIDYYSKFMELIPLGTTYVASVVINALKSIFARHGIPGTLVTDNGPPFDSKELNEFAKNWNFKWTSSSPTYPQSNGQIERAVRTIKTQLKKCLEAGDDPYLVILNYVTTPHDGLKSPAEILMSRKLRTTLPAHPDNYKPSFNNPRSHLKRLQERQQKQEAYYNKHAAPLKPILNKAKVYMQNKNRTWSRAIVLGRAVQPRSYWVQTGNGQVFRRNRHHLRFRYNDQPQEIPKPVTREKGLPGFPEKTLGLNKLIENYNSPCLVDQPVKPMLIKNPHDGKQGIPEKISNVSAEPTSTLGKDETSPIKANSPYKTKIGRTIRKPARFVDFT